MKTRVYVAGPLLVALLVMFGCGFGSTGSSKGRQTPADNVDVGGGRTASSNPSSSGEAPTLSAQNGNDPAKADPIEPEAAPVRSEERLIGLLALPEVFGRFVCDRYVPEPVALRSAPAGDVVGKILIIEPWTYFGDAANTSCDGRKVGVQMSAAEITQPLPTDEYGYEEPGLIVLEQRDRWFRVRLETGSAWLEASDQDTFYDLEKLYADRLIYLSTAWGGKLSPEPGLAGRVVSIPDVENREIVVHEASRKDGELWFRIDITESVICGDGDRSKIAASGWIPAYAQDNTLAIWFFSRGC